MPSPTFASQVALLAAVLCPHLTAQLVTATASAATQLSVTTTMASNSAPIGTNLTGGFTLGANFSLPSGQGASASTTFQVTTVGNSITYGIEQDCTVNAANMFFTAACGPDATVLRLTSGQPTTGTLSVVATGSTFVFGTIPTFFAGQTAIDIGNDGSIEWSAGVVAGGSYQQQITVSGQFEIRVDTSASAALFPNQSLSTASVSNVLEITFEPLAPSCSTRNGSGINPVVCTCATLPVIGSTWNIAIAADPSTLLTLAFASETALPGLPLPFGELLITPPGLMLPGNLVHTLMVPNAPQFIGFPLSVQGARLNTVGAGLVLELTNAIDAIIGL